LSFAIGCADRQFLPRLLRTRDGLLGSHAGKPERPGTREGEDGKTDEGHHEARPVQVHALRGFKDHRDGQQQRDQPSGSPRIVDRIEDEAQQ
jgi:hypothetical protein